MNHSMRLGVGALALGIVAAAAAIPIWRGAGPQSGAPAAPAVSATRERDAVRRFWETFRRAEAARLSGERDRLAEAEQAYREALAIDPEHENALWGLANVLEADGSREEAIDLLRRHAEAHPRSTRAYARLGELLSAPGPARDLAEAERMYRKAVSLNPEESGGYVNLGRLLYSGGDLDAAEAQFRSALKINFKGLVAARYLALIAWRRGDPSRARSELGATLQRFLSDKPRLYALSEGDTHEGEEKEKLTASAREALPAAAFLYLMALAEGESGAPALLAGIATAPLRPAVPGSRLRLRIPDAGARGAATRGVEADLDGDGIPDRFHAGEADAAESAAWFLGGRVHCGARAAWLERGVGAGRYERLGPGTFPPMCLPAGDVSVVDVDGDGDLDLKVEAGGGDPARVDPDVILRQDGGIWIPGL